MDAPRQKAGVLIEGTNGSFQGFFPLAAVFSGGI